jgi:hypothetical protein
MKKLLLIAFVLTTVMFAACKKTENQDQKPTVDYTKPENLSGTTWKCFDLGVDSTMEWAALIFKSTSVVEGWTKKKTANATKDWTGSFAIINTTITFNYLMDTVPQTFSGVISGEVINCQMAGTTVVFKKQ